MFAGIEPGGMTDAYEIKILICYLLHVLKEPITREQMDAVLQGNHLVNYFSYSSAYQDLLKSGHISLEERGGKQQRIRHALVQQRKRAREHGEHVDKRKIGALICAAHTAANQRKHKRHGKQQGKRAPAYIQEHIE